MPALAAGALLQPAPVSARPAGDPPPPPEPGQVQTQLPDTREGALQSEKELIEAFRGAPNRTRKKVMTDLRNPEKP